MNEYNDKWTTVHTIPFKFPVTIDKQKPAAHGGVTHFQIREVKSKLMGRKINVNGKNQEAGMAYPLSTEDVERWEQYAIDSPYENS